MDPNDAPSVITLPNPVIRFNFSFFELVKCRQLSDSSPTNPDKRRANFFTPFSPIRKIKGC
jgi:hypothetical protein